MKEIKLNVEEVVLRDLIMDVCMYDESGCR